MTKLSKKPNQALIALGSNLGERAENIKQAISLIKKRCGSVSATSKFYETLPIGNADQEFINCAILCETNLSPEELLQKLLAIEKDLGRVRKVHWGNRTIDLDIIMMRGPDKSSLSRNSENIVLPHPQALERDFVVLPVCDIAPHWVHPTSNRSFKEERELRGYLC